MQKTGRERVGCQSYAQGPIFMLPDNRVLLFCSRLSAGADCTGACFHCWLAPCSTAMAGDRDPPRVLAGLPQHAAERFNCISVQRADCFSFGTKRQCLCKGCGLQVQTLTLLESCKWSKTRVTVLWWFS